MVGTQAIATAAGIARIAFAIATVHRLLHSVATGNFASGSHPTLGTICTSWWVEIHIAHTSRKTIRIPWAIWNIASFTSPSVITLANVRR